MDSVDSIQRDEKGMFIKGTQAHNTYSDEEMIVFLKQYINHRSNGKDKHSFGKTGCDIKTMESWLTKNESSFPAIRAQVNQAEAKGWDLWESLMFNVGFGIPTPIPMPTKDDPKATFDIDPKYTQPHILMFMMKSKFRSVYGDKLDSTSQTNLNLTGSVPCEVIGPDGKPMRYSMAASNDIGSGTEPGDIEDRSDFERAMNEIKGE